MYSFDKTERYVLAMSDAVISLPVFIPFLKGHASLVERAGGTGSSEPRPFKARGFRLVYLSVSRLRGALAHDGAVTVIEED
jgi:hypothetical protein